MTVASAAGFPTLRPHDLRHLNAVNLVRAGVPLPDVARWLGHSPDSILVTMRYARHAPANAADRARDLLEASPDYSRGRAVFARHLGRSRRQGLTTMLRHRTVRADAQLASSCLAENTLLLPVGSSARLKSCGRAELRLLFAHPRE